ncbi:gibberellin 2-oxidase 6 [Actinidia rufa]|uniref:Gibberellin 2-oxidase 6 n=1 Tax=Actinidia rufa TaxID=165716 RepID=A0A7J0GE75_9ERIC|nr:gibberellin 2-oxidase 6 [Actinidia rufa]
MVVVTPTSIPTEKMREIELPVIDLSVGNRSELSKLIVKASEEFGFFKVINHGVAENVITKMEEESFKFFAQPVSEKHKAGPANPYGYGNKNIGLNGDVGEVEYLLLSTNSLSISQTAKTISNDPIKFRSAVSGYVEAVRELACEILDMMAEGLWVPHTSVFRFSTLIRDLHNDSLFRLNHYPPLTDHDTSPTSQFHRIGFGEHSDPQILTLLTSNDVPGLQISPEEGCGSQFHRTLLRRLPSLFLLVTCYRP